jgi:dipeptidyl aminopeptidase/acylaminoacyl peptidase
MTERMHVVSRLLAVLPTVLPVAGALTFVIGSNVSAQIGALHALKSDEVAKLVGATDSSYMFITRPSDRDYNRVELVTVNPKTRQPLTRTPTEMGCARVHASDAGSIYCFTRVQPGKPKYYTGATGYVFDPQMKLTTTHTERKGSVSRARFSRDGRYIANTAFTAGHSYLGVGGTSFSTATFIGYATTPRKDDNLQLWPIAYQGKAVTSVDLNLWGVTFDPANSDRFLVTAYFDGKPHLAEGSVQARKINVLRSGVECPAFSPDGKRIAFKKRVSPTQWIPALLDLASGVETAFSIEESVDDQIEWFDNNTLIFELALTPLVGAASVNLYTLNVAQSPSQAQTKPLLWLSDARSPTFVRR